MTTCRIRSSGDRGAAAGGFTSAHAAAGVGVTLAHAAAGGWSHRWSHQRMPRLTRAAPLAQPRHALMCPRPHSAPLTAAARVHTRSRGAPPGRRTRRTAASPSRAASTTRAAARARARPRAPECERRLRVALHSTPDRRPALPCRDTPRRRTSRFDRSCRRSRQARDRRRRTTSYRASTESCSASRTRTQRRACSHACGANRTSRWGRGGGGGGGGERRRVAYGSG